MFLVVHIAEDGVSSARPNSVLMLYSLLYVLETYQKLSPLLFDLETNFPASVWTVVVYLGCNLHTLVVY